MENANHANSDDTADIEAFINELTSTISDNVEELTSNTCAIVDSVMDLDFFAGHITHFSADKKVDRDLPLNCHPT